jgi:hypothetical protein
MKKQIFSVVALLSLGFAACNNDSNTTVTTEDTTYNSRAGTMNTTGDYSAMADEFDRNSEAGLYRDERTGQPLRISVDRTTGTKVNTSNNQPVTRYIYVDNNDWWVYDTEGNRLRQARMENNRVLYQGENNQWVEWDKVKWDEDGSYKMKNDDMKIKSDGDGNMKMKTDDKKIKVEDGKTKVKTDN